MRYAGLIEILKRKTQLIWQSKCANYVLQANESKMCLLGLIGCHSLGAAEDDLLQNFREFFVLLLIVSKSKSSKWIYFKGL